MNNAGLLGEQIEGWETGRPAVLGHSSMRNWGESNGTAVDEAWRRHSPGVDPQEQPRLELKAVERSHTCLGRRLISSPKYQFMSVRCEGRANNQS